MAKKKFSLPINQDKIKTILALKEAVAEHPDMPAEIRQNLVDNHPILAKKIAELHSVYTTLQRAAKVKKATDYEALIENMAAAFEEDPECNIHLALWFKF